MEMAKRTTTKLFVVAILGMLFSVSALAQSASRRDEDSGSSLALRGPGIHLFGGIRMQKSPNIDTFDSAVFGFKVSAVNLFFGKATYLSIVAPGVGYVNQQNRLAFLLAPLIFNHASGLGLSFDLYDVRPDRTGGPFGVSVNLDPIQLANFVMGIMNR